QHPDMQIEAERVGHPVKPVEPAVTPAATGVTHHPVTAPSAITPPANTPPVSAPASPPPATAGTASTSSPVTQTTPASAPPNPPPERFNRGMNRPGVSRHLSNRRRR
ncbi:MAG: hypothetical protein AAF404_08090, partial [Pseudomonadota bacterium]